MTSLANADQQARAMEDVLANDIDTHHSRTPAGKPPRKRRVSAFSRRKVDHAYYWMAVPAAVIFAVFLYVPFVRGIMYSFTNSQGYGSCNWIGFQNYFALFRDERVGHAYLFTFLIAIAITVLINVIALFLSVALNGKIACKNGFRAIYFIPYTLAVLVIGYVFKYIFMQPLPELGKALANRLPCHICKLSLNLRILICRYSHRFSHSRMRICNLRKCVKRDIADPCTSPITQNNRATERRRSPPEDAVPATTLRERTLRERER